jgi:hypothetical protein
VAATSRGFDQAATRLGLHAEPLLAADERLVHRTVSADPLVQCETRVVSLTGTEDELGSRTATS